MPVSDNDNIFLRGLESLGEARLSRTLGVGLSSGKLSLQTLYRNPTIDKLASATVDIIFNRGILEHAIICNVRSIELVVEEFTENLPTMPDPLIRQQSFIAKELMLFSPAHAARWRLTMVRELLDDLHIKNLYCFNRGKGGHERLRASSVAQGLRCDTDCQRLSFMRIALGEPQLGLSTNHYTELLQSARIVIHNAWKVDFSWTLDSYKVEHLRSIRALFRNGLSLLHKATELPFEGAESYNVASSLVYGQSKHVPGWILSQASAISGIPVTILHVGQVAGPTTACGTPWSEDFRSLFCTITRQEKTARDCTLFSIDLIYPASGPPKSRCVDDP
ncbi:hypothetical protein BGZ60DRAFT_526912 [Tricladium varicosporioides]|nr:hypothetical protein BGZ60DRAFT_526912 [Hymenoscyphus varicosporioides]